MSQSSIHSAVINGFKGYLQTDEYSGYEAALKEHKILYPKDKIVHIACAAHIRRKFYDAFPTENQGTQP